MNYNKQILKPIISGKTKRSFAFTEAMAYFLHTLSQVDLGLIESAKVYSRSPYRYVPWYPATKGGGAITLGSRRKSSITFTENFFSSDTRLYKSKAYAEKLGVWIRLAAHEVTHLEHAKRFKYLIVYLLVFIYQYIRYGHDGAPLEIEANFGTERYDAFNYYMRNCEGLDLIQTIFNEDLNQGDQIRAIDKYWEKFLAFQSNKS